MTARTQNDVNMKLSQADAPWLSRLSMRASSQSEGESGALGHLPGGSVAKTLALCCALVLSAVALRGLAAQGGQSDGPSSTRAQVTAQVRNLPAGD